MWPGDQGSWVEVKGLLPEFTMISMISMMLVERVVDS